MMRSRTEMVTTTFVDSEEDFSDDDDSEEDWKPSASNKNGKKQKPQKGSGGGVTKRGRKRKGSTGAINKSSKIKPAFEESDNCEDDEPSEDNYEYDDFDTGSVPSKKRPSDLQQKQKISDKSSSNSESSSEFGDILNLLVYVKDLTSVNANLNNRLCLWRKDSNNLLQKYIRVRTTPDKFLFTSSSVYSSFDDKRASDFYGIRVKSMDSAHRRVQITNPSELHNIAQKYSNKGKKTIGNKNVCYETDNTKYKRSKDVLKKGSESTQDYVQQDNDEDDEEENEEDEVDNSAESDNEEDEEN